MIFVTVGMHHQGFDRLIKAMDELANQIDEPVVMQIGSANYEPVHAQWFRYDSQEKVEELCTGARVIVGHAGAGTVLSAIHCGRPVVVIPRRFIYQEHVDDHQIELAQVLSAQKKAIMIEEPTVQRLQLGIDQATGLETIKRDVGHLAEAILETLENSSSTHSQNLR